MKALSVRGTLQGKIGLSLLLAGVCLNAGAAVGPTLADSPLFSTIVVPANVILDLSVEFPTAVGDAYATAGAYSTTNEYLGYFNPNFCYDYVANAGGNSQTALFETLLGYFKPAGAASVHTCVGHWSGNLLNWVNTQTIDPLRKTMTGGARIADTSSATVLQRAYQDSQSGGSNQNIKSIVNNAAVVSGATPFTTWKSIYFNNRNTGLNFIFSQAASLATGNTSGTEFGSVTVASAENTFAGCSSTSSSSVTAASPTVGNIALGDSPKNLTVTTTAGCTNSSTITINGNKVATGVPSGTALLTVTGLGASGVTASLSPASVALSTTATSTMTSTLTLTAGSSAVAGTYTVTITGTAGAKTASTTVTMTVATPVVTTNNTIYQAQSASQVCTSSELSGTYSEAESNSYAATAADGSAITVNGRCRNYGGNYKPVGLMQKYAAETTSQTDAIRYSAFGYLLDAQGSGGPSTRNEQLDGGVMRAKMKSPGPYKANPGQTVVVNAAKEWDAATGVFVINPNTADASATGVGNSGVANYLNKFGFVPTASYTAGTRAAYKRYDSVGELYYMATRYYRNLGNLASHTDTAAAITAGEATNDNFPVIKTWDDPIAYTCSTNYIVGIGDIHSWDDANLPGVLAGVKGSQEVAAYAPSDDPAVNASTATDFIANLEHNAGDTGGITGRSAAYTAATGLGDALIGGIAAPSGGWGASQNSFLMAGLAFDVHTRDIRPDITVKAAPITVSTFYLDVMEGNDYRQKNQFWMTAKYGGFNTSDPAFGVNGFPLATNASPAVYPAAYSGTTSTDVIPLSSWNTGGYVDDRKNYAPDQYFQAGNPAKMAAGLNAAFSKISSSIPAGVANALALNSSSVSNAGNVNYVASYANDWSGSIIAQSLSLDVTGAQVSASTSTTTTWSTSTLLPPSTTSGALTATTRIIATSSARGAGNGVAFEIGSGGITATQQATLGSSANEQTDVLNYIRGDACNEKTAGLAKATGCATTTGANSLGFRPRPASVMGDITNSKPTVVAAPSLPYADTPLNPGYSSFKVANAARPATLYVGANDGMLHAFDATAASTGGTERFAYIPSALLTANVDANSAKLGLSSLTLNPLKHHFMVDAQPVVIDIDFNRTNTTWVTPPGGYTADWRTVAISGLGKGGGASGSVVGGGYFALDVTDPAAITSETLLKSKVLWETSPTALPHMGYSYGTPLVVKTQKYGWTLVLASGYGNDDGVGYFYLVNPKDGSLYEQISTGAGTTTAPAGLAQVTASILNQADFTADALYAGDLLGNVWRVDLTTTSGLSAVKFATLTDSGGAGQPVTTRPVIGFDPSKGTRYVFVGTGQLLADSDLVNAQTQSFYAFVDGDNSKFDSTSTLPFTKSDLALDTPATGITLSGSQKGFYYDLAAAVSAGAGTQPSAERVNVQPVAGGGDVGFAANLYGQNVCLKGSSRIFAFNYDSGVAPLGQTLLQSSTGTLVNSIGYATGVVTNLTLTSTAPPLGPSTTPSGLMLMWGLDTTAGGGGQAAKSTVQGDILSHGGYNLTRINWRELPDVQ